ncbi:MAG: peptidoglycan DD-metalloendopeptidase family protein [Deltaproteobacteria bacterium]|nr:peptidoglycan DD-metalloendopeptidase family protein [Deltaproteobacteria bacterium]
MNQLFDLKRRGCIKFIIFILPFFLLSACSMPHDKHVQGKGVYHRVKSGENLYQIARAYNVSLQELAEANNIVDPDIVQADTIIFIPNANEVIDHIISSAQSEEESAGTGHEGQTAYQAYGTEAKPGTDRESSVATIKKSERMTEGIKPYGSAIIEEDTTKEKEATSLKGDQETKSPTRLASITPPQKPEKKAEPPVQAIEGTISSGIEFDKKRFIWPLKGIVVSRFGIQSNGMYLNGIKIAAKEGSKVVASAAGTVIFSSSVRGYGETIIIKHKDNFATVYTHLYNRIVNVEDSVKKGDMIALVGRLEKDHEAYLNFEIRKNNKARNPLFFLP